MSCISFMPQANIYQTSTTKLSSPSRRCEISPSKQAPKPSDPEMIVAKAGDDLFQYLTMYMLNEVMNQGDVAIARVKTKETIDRVLSVIRNDLNISIDEYVHDHLIPMLYTQGDEAVANARAEILG
jgi:hypothetical protein